MAAVSLTEVSSVGEFISRLSGKSPEPCNVYGFSLSNAVGQKTHYVGLEMRPGRCSQYVPSLLPEAEGGGTQSEHWCVFFCIWLVIAKNLVQSWRGVSGDSLMCKSPSERHV